jgi:hypothetical protein
MPYINYNLLMGIVITGSCLPWAEKPLTKRLEKAELALRGLIKAVNLIC